MQLTDSTKTSVMMIECETRSQDVRGSGFFSLDKFRPSGQTFEYKKISPRGLTKQHTSYRPTDKDYTFFLFFLFLTVNNAKT